MDTLERTGDQGLGNFWEQAMHTDPSILQAVMQGKSNAFPQDVAMSALMAQNKLRTAAQGKPQPQQPTVKQRMLGAMPPQQPQTQMQQPQQAAEPPQQPEDSGIAQHARGGSVGWAEGGILGYADGGIAHFDAGGNTTYGDSTTIDPLAAAMQLEKPNPTVAALAKSVYSQESTSGANTRPSNHGAVGGMQIEPATFGQYADKNWNITNPIDNARVGIRYITDLHKQSGGDVYATAAGYYGGPKAITATQNGMAYSDLKNPNAPNTLQYARTVGDRALSMLAPEAQAAENPQTQGLGSTPPAQTTPNAPTPATDDLSQYTNENPYSFGTGISNLFKKAADSNYLRQVTGNMASIDGASMNTTRPELPAQLAAVQGHFAAQNNPITLSSPQAPANVAPASTQATVPAAAEPQPPVVDPNAPTTPQNTEAKQPGAAAYYDQYIRQWLGDQANSRAQAMEQGKGIAALKAAAAISQPGQPGGLLSGLARGAGAAGEVAGQVSQEQYMRDKEMGAMGLGALQNQGMMAYRDKTLGINQQKLSTAQHTAALSQGEKMFQDLVAKNPTQYYSLQPAQQKVMHDNYVAQAYQTITGQSMPESQAAPLPAGFNALGALPPGATPMQLKPQ